MTNGTWSALGQIAIRPRGRFAASSLPRLRPVGCRPTAATLDSATEPLDAGHGGKEHTALIDASTQALTFEPRAFDAEFVPEVNR